MQSDVAVAVTVTVAVAVAVAVAPKYRIIQQADTRPFNYGRCIIIHHHTDYEVRLTFEQLPDDDTLVLKYVAFIRYKYVLKTIIIIIIIII